MTSGNDDIAAGKAVWYGPRTAGTHVFFVHGFRGNIHKTWGQFPDLLESDPNLPDLCAGSCGYDSGFLRKCPGIQAAAEAILAHLVSIPITPDRVFLVGHSIGGLVVLEAVIRELMNERAQLSPINKIDAIALFATPLEGELIRRVLGGIIKSPLGWLARKLWQNQQLIDLHTRKVIDLLRGEVINRIYRPPRPSTSSRAIPIHTFVASKDNVVTEEAVKAWFRDPPPRSIQAANHTTLKLPISRRDIRYLLLRNALNQSVSTWFRKLAADAADQRSRTHHRSFLQLSRAYEKKLTQRLSLIFGADRWHSASRAPQERRHLLSLLIRQAVHLPDEDVSNLFKDAMSIYCEIRRRTRAR